jgi:hypothetical protein
LTDLPRLAFAHVPKTAGTSVRELLSAAYGKEAFPGMTTLDYVCYSNEELAKYRFHSGHAYLRDLLRLPSGTIRLAIFRDPVKRAISLYQYYAGIANWSDDPNIREAIDTAKNKGIIEFLHSNNPMLIEHLRGGQVRQFIDNNILDELGHRRTFTGAIEKRIAESFFQTMEGFAFVFTVDWLETSIACMGHELGLPIDARLGRANVSCPQTEIDDMQVRRATWDISALDYLAYDYARERERDFLRKRIFVGAYRSETGLEYPHSHMKLQTLLSQLRSLNH